MYGVQEYRIDATETRFELNNERSISKGLSIKRGSMADITIDDFQGKKEKTDFK